MKVVLNFTVAINPDRWTEEYNLDPDDDVTQDVVRHITNTVDAHLNSLGLLTGGPR